MKNDNSTKASLHRISEFVKQTRIILSMSHALLNIYSGGHTSNSVRTSPQIIRLNAKELKKFVSDWIIENAHNAGTALKNIGDRLATVEMIIEEKKSDRAYFTSICELLVAFDEANMSDILLDSKYEKHFHEVIHKHIKTHAIELAELEQEIEDIFAPLHENSPLDLFLELESVIERFRSQEENQNIDIEFYRPRYMPPLLALSRKPFRMLTMLLLENALKYTGEMRQGETPWIKIEIFESNNEFRVNIQNWGPPIFREEENRIEESGFRGSSAKALGINGHGQGLAQVKEISDTLGLKVVVRTKEDVSLEDWSLEDSYITNATIKIPKIHSRSR